jgi:protoporphyrinogen oxidase
MKVAIIGGGLMGLATAWRLGAIGHRVTVYESAPQVGGLTTWHDYGAFVWDRFYHVILPSDTALLRFVREIGLGDELCWVRSRTGYFVDGAFHGLSSNAEFLKFAPLSAWSKLRLAFTILYCARLRDWKALEREPLESFLVRLSGRSTFDKFWKPLLLAKLGPHYQRTSAVFIWTYIRRLYSARDGAGSKEQLGYVRGGYHRIFDRLQQRIRAGGGEIRVKAAVESIVASAGGGIDLRCDGRAEHFDKVIATTPVDMLRRLCDASLLTVPERDRDVEYLGVVCVAVLTRQPLTPYYVLNVADEKVPFTGVIGMSTIVDTAQTGGLHLTYLPKYVLGDDAMLEQADDTIKSEFLAALRRMYPTFPPGDIVGVHVHRARRVQPLQVLGYSSLVPQPRTLHADFLVLNTAQFVNNTLNNNEVIRSVEQFLADQAAHFAPVPANEAAPVVAQVAAA